MRRHPYSLFLLVAVAAGCANGPASGPGTSLSVGVAPLTLDGLTDACYDVAVDNDLGQRVWSRGTVGLSVPDGDTTALCASQYGFASGGDLSYVGPCDASDNADDGAVALHTVTLWVDSLRGPGGSVLSDWQDPCPTGCALPVECRENADTPVTFNLTIMRAAEQGFFDIAVNFDTIFCSAKVDCVDANGAPLQLLFNGLERDTTVVSAFACTGGAGDATGTVLFRDPLVITCDAGTTTLDPAIPEGNAWPGGDPEPNDSVWA